MSPQLPPRDPSDLQKLTSREREVLCLVIQGLASKQIARQLRVGESTVKSHLARIYIKLDVQNRTEAASAFLQLTVLASHEIARAS